MIAIVGLGNLGVQYTYTRHNIGFMALNSFAAAHNLPFTKKKYNGTVAEGVIQGKKVVLLKPSTFMNRSGESVLSLVRKLKLPIEKLIVVYDDIDLPPAKIRLRASGSGGTHNGMRNIIEMLGSKDFPRVRIGIGNNEKIDLAKYVLMRIEPEQMPEFEKTFQTVNEILLALIKNNCVVEKIDVSQIS